jgi:3-oxoacyl-[acyl-carrier protein] reductase
MDLGLSGARVLVVGATGSIGGAVVRTLLVEGAQVVPAGRDEVALAQLAEVGGARVPGTVVLDLAVGSSVEAGVARAADLLGGLDGLVVAAAGDRFRSLWDVGREEWSQELAVKYIGTGDVCRCVARRMVEQGAGAIVVLTGIAAVKVFSANPMNHGANAALESFVRVLGAEVARHGVRVLGVSPGMTMSRRFEAFASDQRDRILASIPVGRIAEPEEVADVVTFLLSNRARYMTGSIVTVDGGLATWDQRLAQDTDRLASWKQGASDERPPP